MSTQDKTTNRPKRIVFFTGSGISAESGIKTFRDAGGLWEDHNVHDVATPEAFMRNPGMVLRFYNARRRQMYEVEPNAAHRFIAELEGEYDVQVVTQNVDNLHERAGSSNVLHLHGELDKGRSSSNPNLIVPLYGKDINLEDRAPDNTQLRPHVVWFGEAVPAIEQAIPIIERADVLVVIGTSLQVYPAAGLLDYMPKQCKLICVDPSPEIQHSLSNKVLHIAESAVCGVEKLKTLL
jgi:NAD-dependent deacetylase